MAESFAAAPPQEEVGNDNTEMVAEIPVVEVESGGGHTPKLSRRRSRIKHSKLRRLKHLSSPSHSGKKAKATPDLRDIPAPKRRSQKKRKKAQDGEGENKKRGRGGKKEEQIEVVEEEEEEGKEDKKAKKEEEEKAKLDKD